MAWSWGDAIDGTTDWSDVGFQNAFRLGASERYRARGLSAPASISSGVSAGDDIATASHYADMQNFGATAFAKKITLEGSASGAIATYVTLAAVRTQAGLTGSNWRRKRPREISSTSATTDTQGNARAMGQHAILTAGAGTRGAVYTFNGTTWALDTGSKPDLLDSQSAAPNAVAAGTMQAGDYIGEWIFNELMAVYKVCVWTISSFTVTGFLRPSGGAGAGTGGDFATAKAASESNYAGSTVTTFSGLPTTEMAFAQLSIDGSGNTSASVFRRHLHVTASPPSFVSRNVQFYVAGERTSSPNADYTYDDNGDGPVSIPEGFYTKYDESGPTTAASISSAELGQAWPVPNWPADGSFPSHQLMKRGWGIDDLKAIVEWDVAGGFTYP
jgi:hypothetical protein